MGKNTQKNSPKIKFMDNYRAKKYPEKYPKNKIYG
jgi:hypothetical protein